MLSSPRASRKVLSATTSARTDGSAGTFENLRFIFSGRFGAISKLKLAENLRRAVTPISVITALLCGFIAIPETAAPIAAIALGGYLFPYVWGLVKTVLHEASARAGSSRGFWDRAASA